MKVGIDTALQGTVVLGVLRLSNITHPSDEGAALWGEIEQVSAALRTEYEGNTVGQVPGIGRARTLYRSIGIDPTKNRPSSEALLRRLLKGKSLYRIHPLVDLFNLISLKMLTPVGLYDESKIQGDTVTVRIGRAAEGYDGIRKDRVNVAERFCIADAAGPFGSPTSDSLRTSVDGRVPDALAVFFQHASVDIDVLEQCLTLAADAAARYLGAEVIVKESVQG